MTNDLDLNISDGEFRFDAADHDKFVKHLRRTSESDKDGSSAYSYGNWTFWISPDKGNCRFYMRLNHDKMPSEQGADSHHH